MIIGFANALNPPTYGIVAEQVGAVSGQIFLLETGHPIEFTADGEAHKREAVPAGRVMVDSGSLEEVEDVVIRDRRHLSEDGVVVTIIAIDKHTGRVEVPPEIVTRGFLSGDDGQEMAATGKRLTME